MRIRNHRLADHWHQRSKDIGAELTDLRFIVLHYTAGGSAEASRDFMLKSPTEKQRLVGGNKKVFASAHIVVGRQGGIWQIVPFNMQARHAGKSLWKGLTSLNRHSIGIEIANYGWLDQQGDGTYKRSDTPAFEARDVTIGPMPGAAEIKGWENYPAQQLDAVERVTRSLLGHYPSIVEVVGHQDISPGRKFDPGPAFPMQRFRNLIDNRGEGALDNERNAVERPNERYAATTRVNIRGGPGTAFDRLEAGPLEAQAVVEKHDEEGVWYFVSLAGNESIRGWVHSRYLRLMRRTEQERQAEEND